MIVQIVWKKLLIVAAMVENGISEECAKQCIKLIAQGKVPAVSIAY